MPRFPLINLFAIALAWMVCPVSAEGLAATAQLLSPPAPEHRSAPPRADGNHSLFAPPARLPTQGQPLPSFALAALEGGSVHDSDLRGHYALISTFFAACAPCIAEVPALNAYASKHPQMRFLAVTFEDRTAAASFVQQHSLQWPVAYAAAGWLNATGVRSYPTLILLDPQGAVIATRSGVEPATLAPWLDAQLHPFTR